MTPTVANMIGNTPEEPGTDAETNRQDLVDGSLILAQFPSELLVILAETLGNPLALLVSKAHLSKAFCEAARAAQATLTHIDLGKVVVSFSVKQCGRQCGNCLSSPSSCSQFGCGTAF